MAAILKSRYDVITLLAIVRILRKFHADAKWHAIDHAYVEIETGNRIPIWRPSVFQNRSSYISGVDWNISTKFGTQIDYGLPKHIPSLNLNPVVVFRLYGRHMEFRFLFQFWRKYSYRHDILHLLAKFRSNRTISGGVMTSYRFYNMAAVEPETTSGLRFNDRIWSGGP